MNPDLQRLHPYPFERLAALLAGVPAPAALSPVLMSIGEPRHAAPAFVLEEISARSSGYSQYPKTAGVIELREAIATWLVQRYELPATSISADAHVLPVNGSREALFAFTQCAVSSAANAAPLVAMPNPFYQIYEGAAFLAGAQPYYAPSDPSRNFAVDWDSVPDDVWARTQLLYVCSPGNPTGAVMPLAEWQKLFELSDRHGFVIASDECYSEIYFRD